VLNRVVTVLVIACPHALGLRFHLSLRSPQRWERAMVSLCATD
jgi:hypothetical protein